MAEWCVAEGRPSYHQARAGGAAAGYMCFSTKIRALRFMAGFKKHHPHESVRLIPPQGMSGARKRRRRRR